MERKRLPATAREAFMILYAVEASPRHVQSYMESLTKRTKFGWRNFRLAQVMLAKCVEQIMDTIPPDQLLTIARQMEVSEFKIASKAVGARQKDDGLWVIPKDDLTKLVGFAVETTCAVCDGKSKCELRNMLDDLPVTIENEQWMPCKGGGI